MEVFGRIKAMFTTSSQSSTSVREDFNAEDIEPGNGLRFNSIYIPEELLLHILSYVPTEQLVTYSLVCKEWNTCIKSPELWKIMFKRRFKKQAKHVPWYVYYALFNTDLFEGNLLRNGHGQEKFKYWDIYRDGGDRFIVEPSPVNADSLETVGIQNLRSCFATSFQMSKKLQVIKMDRPLYSEILDRLKPHIYVSEYIAARFDSGIKYELKCELTDTTKQQKLKEKIYNHRIEQWQGGGWVKIECTFDDYPSGVRNIIFNHGGCDTLFWKGHYGPKMAGGVVKLLFDTMQDGR